MQKLNRHDRSVEKPIYSNEKVAEFYYNGQLTRSEAEVLDIIYAGFAQEDDTGLTEMRGIGEQWEASCVAIVHDGAIIPIINLEEIILQPGMSAEKWLICKQAATIIYDVLLTLLKDEGYGKV